MFATVSEKGEGRVFDVVNFGEFCCSDNERLVLMGRLTQT